MLFVQRLTDTYVGKTSRQGGAVEGRFQCEVRPAFSSHLTLADHGG